MSQRTSIKNINLTLNLWILNLPGLKPNKSDAQTSVSLIMEWRSWLILHCTLSAKLSTGRNTQICLQHYKLRFQDAIPSIFQRSGAESNLNETTFNDNDTITGSCLN